MGLSPDLARLLERRPASTPEQFRTAVVVRSDVSGVWAAPLGTDARTPLGPCRGATRPRARTETGGAGDGAHAHDLAREQLPAGTVVLLATTGDRPWVTAWEGA